MKGYKQGTRRKVSFCLFCQKSFEHYLSQAGKYCSRYCANQSGDLRRGKPCTPEARAKLRQVALEKRDLISKGWFQPGHKKWDHPNCRKTWIKPGTKPKNWQGGVTPRWKKLMDDPRYKVWRNLVFARDNYRCVWCGTGGRLEADHILPKSKYPEFAFDITNGRALCPPCHRKTDTYGRSR